MNENREQQANSELPLVFAFGESVLDVETFGPDNQLPTPLTHPSGGGIDADR